MKTSSSGIIKSKNEHSEFLILADGKILAHNITLEMASVLAELNPDDQAMKRRAKQKSILKHELPN